MSFFAWNLLAAEAVNSDSDEVNITVIQEDGTIFDIRSEILQWILIIAIVLLSTMFSGLILGLMTLDTRQLTMYIEADPNSDEAKQAATILPLRAKGHLLLCTLLVGNTISNSAISILLAEHIYGILGLFVSAGVIVTVGEILPQATCSKYNLLIGARATKPMWLFMALLYPITKPIALGVDLLVGKQEASALTGPQLAALLRMNYEDQVFPEDRNLETSLTKIHESHPENIESDVETGETDSKEHLSEIPLVDEHVLAVLVEKFVHEQRRSSGSNYDKYSKILNLLKPSPRPSTHVVVN